ncbi:MAG: class II histone deacetylase [Rubrobacter sp.]|nr:class II histone deacetylase [Rubrobacter sp.]
MAYDTAFYHDERCLWHTTGEAVLVLPVGGWLQPPAGGGHAESPETKRRFKSLVDVSGLGAEISTLSAPEADDEDLRRVHLSEYLERFEAASRAGGGEEGLFAPFGPGSYEIAKLSAGLAKRAVSDVLSGEFRNAYSLSRPPGHHCLADSAMGFCLLANIPIAVEAAKADYGLGKVAIVDWDVHHGNGTQSIFYERPDVLTISLHQENCFPPGGGGFDERGEGEGEGSNINVPLPPGSGHEAYLHAMRRVVVPALERFEPELIVIASGLDASAADPLARQMLYGESYREMARLMMEAAESLCGGRLVAVHEGGYAESTVPFCGLAMVEALSGFRTAVEDPFEELFAAQQPSERVVAFQRGLIDEMAEALAR